MNLTASRDTGNHVPAPKGTCHFVFHDPPIVLATSVSSSKCRRTGIFLHKDETAPAPEGGLPQGEGGCGLIQKGLRGGCQIQLLEIFHGP